MTRNPIAEADRRPSIFVHIASYRDADTRRTIEDLFEKAAYPERIFVGVVWQLEPGVDDDLLFKPSRPCQVRELKFNARDSQGVGWARAHAQTLWRDEEFVLQIDAHHRFAAGWDELLIDNLALCPSDKPVLSTYPQGFRLPDTIISGSPLQVVFKEFDRKTHVPALTSRLLSQDERQAGKPVRSAFCAAGFLFAPARIIGEIPYDPMIYFSGEEIALSVRLWSWGWDVYAPPCHILWHLWDKSGRPTHWNDNPNFGLLQARGHKRLRHLLGASASDDPDAIRDLDRFGLGQVRTLAGFERFAGVKFADHRIEERARKGMVDGAPQPQESDHAAGESRVAVSAEKVLNLKALRKKGEDTAEAPRPAAPRVIAERPRAPRKVLESDQIVVFDDFLPETIYDEVYRWTIYADYQHVNMGEKISRTWRPHDGFPMRGLRNCFYQHTAPAPADKKAWQYPTGTAFDLFADRVAETAPAVEKVVGRRGVDWLAFSVTAFLYPARSGLSLHRDGRGAYSGAYTFFMAPRWDIHWGGLLVVLDGRTVLGDETVNLYGQGKSIKNVWLDRDRETPFVFEPGIGQLVLPKRNRIVFIEPNCYHMITYVNEYAGDNVRMAYSGFFHSKDDQGTR